MDFARGKVVHDVKVFDVAEPQVAFDGYNTHATPTPVAEQGRVYVHFGAYGTACLDTRTGAKLWERRDLKCDHRVRPASSPIVDGERLFLVFDGADAQFIVALDKKTGATRWQRERKSGVDFEATLKAKALRTQRAWRRRSPTTTEKPTPHPRSSTTRGKSSS